MATAKKNDRSSVKAHNEACDKWMKEAKKAQKAGDKKKMAELMKKNPGNKIMID